MTVPDPDALVGFPVELPVELDARRHEFAELNLPRFQTGFPPQHLVLTLFGDFWANRTEAIPSAAIVDLLADFGVNEAGARAAIARLASRGNLDIVRAGRATSYAVTPRLAKLLPYGPLHTQTFGTTSTGWDGTWTTVAFSIADHAPRGLRAQVRAELEMLRFAPLHDGLWVSPVPPSAALRAVLTANRAVSSTIIHGTADTNAGLRPPIAAWDLAGLRRVYDDFLAAFEPLHARLHRDGLDDREALVARVRVAYRWFVIATTDPDLPAELLPANWPRNDAHAIYADLFDLLGPPAADRVRHIFSQRAPSLAALVAHAPRHQTG